MGSIFLRILGNSSVPDASINFGISSCVPLPRWPVTIDLDILFLFRREVILAVLQDSCPWKSSVVVTLSFESCRRAGRANHSHAPRCPSYYCTWVLYVRRGDYGRGQK